MDTKLAQTDSIRPYPQNPRLNDRAVDAVAASIREFGFLQPIVVDADGVIIVGHARWKAAKKLGLTQVPVYVAADLTPEQRRAYRIADNKTSELAAWDFSLLEVEFQELRLPDGKWLDLGFTPAELASLTTHLAPLDWEKEWDGMPEYSSEDMASWRRIIVHLRGPDDLAPFASLVGQPLTDRTRAIWWPAAPQISMAGIEAVGES